MRLEDERTRYFALAVVGLPVEDIIAFSERYPALDMVCLKALSVVSSLLKAIGLKEIASL